MKPKSQIIKRMDGIDLSGGYQKVNAVVVENADVSKFIGSFTETEATDKYRAGYCGKNNQIVAQGMVLFKWNGTAPNGAIVDKVSETTDMSLIPDIPFYTDVDFYPYSVYYTRDNPSNRVVYDIKGMQVKFEGYTGRNSKGNPFFNCKNSFKAFAEETGEPINDGMFFASARNGNVGFTFAWENIFPPDSVYTVIDGKTRKFKYGYVLAKLLQIQDKELYNEDSCEIIRFNSFPVPFASMDEYNAAVCLTDEPQ